MKTLRFTVYQFDRESGKRISTIGACNLVRALTEAGPMLPVLDRAIIIMPTDLARANDTFSDPMTMAKAQALAVDDRFDWFSELPL